MNLESAQNLLVKRIIGFNPSFSQSVLRGAGAGVLFFGIFEAVSMINPNAPRIPVPTLLVIAVFVLQMLLFLKISRILRFPRIEDFLFIIRISYRQRKKIAVRALLESQKAILPFISSCTLVSVILEIFIYKERELSNLAGVPAGLLLFTYFFPRIGASVLKSNLVRPVSRDSQQSGVQNSQGIRIFTVLSRFFFCVSNAAGKLAPISLRPYVTRNMLYLFRSDPFLFPFFTLVAPVLLILVLVLIGDRELLFVDFFTVLTFFVLSFYYATYFQEASVWFRECPYYDFSHKRMRNAQIFTSAILSIPYTVIFLSATNTALLSLAGMARTVTFLCALGTIILINCRISINPKRKDSDIGIDLALFIGVAIGIFVPLFGWLFPLAITGVINLLGWGSVCKNRQC